LNHAAAGPWSTFLPRIPVGFDWRRCDERLAGKLRSFVVIFFLFFREIVLTKNKQNFLLETFPKKEGSLKFTLCD